MKKNIIMKSTKFVVEIDDRFFLRSKFVIKVNQDQ